MPASTFLEPGNGRALVAFQVAEVEMPEEEMIDTHCAQAKNAPLFLPSTTSAGAMPSNLWMSTAV